MEIDTTTTTTTPPSKLVPTPNAETLPECEVYLRLLIINYLLSTTKEYEKTLKLAHETVEKIQTWNRRSMDALAARVWFALGRAYELGGELAEVRP